MLWEGQMCPFCVQTAYFCSERGKSIGISVDKIHIEQGKKLGPATEHGCCPWDIDSYGLSLALVMLISFGLIDTAVEPDIIGFGRLISENRQVSGYGRYVVDSEHNRSEEMLRDNPILECTEVRDV